LALKELRKIQPKTFDGYSVISQAKAHRANAVMNIKTTIEPDRNTASLRKLADFISGSFVAL